MRHEHCRWWWCVCLCDASSEKSLFAPHQLWAKQLEQNYLINWELRRMAQSRRGIHTRVLSAIYMPYSKCVYSVSVCWFVRHVLFPFTIRVNFFVMTCEHAAHMRRSMWLRSMPYYLVYFATLSPCLCYPRHISFVLAPETFQTRMNIAYTQTLTCDGDWESCHSIDWRAHDNLGCNTIFLPHL